MCIADNTLHRHLRNTLSNALGRTCKKIFSKQALKNAGTLNFVPTAQNLLVPLRFYEERARLRENIFLQARHKADRKHCFAIA